LEAYHNGCAEAFKLPITENVFEHVFSARSR
jgi:hypothetical protein